MATRKCGNIYSPKYFMAVRPFFTRNFFLRIIWVGGVKTYLLLAKNENIYANSDRHKIFPNINMYC